VFAKSFNSLVHRPPQVGFVLSDLGIVELPRPVGPRSLWERDERRDDQA